MAVQPGWPCALLPASPPSVGDRLSAPAQEDLLPQVIATAPRGVIWGTDEASDGTGASPVMRKVWTAMAGWMADLYKAAFDTAVQCFPSGITFSLEDWEAEYGLPDPCTSPDSGVQGRINAVRARFGAQGGSSPAYFVCLAASIGYEVSITEPSDFICDVSECDGDDTVVNVNGHHEWVVRLNGLGDTWFYCDEGECDDTPLEGFAVAADLECVFRRLAPLHTTVVFDYTAAFWSMEGSSLDFDFVNDVYAIDRTTVERAAAFTCTRNSPGMAQKADGTWVSFGANEPRITDKGLLVEEARTNQVKNSGMVGAVAGVNGSPTGWGYSAAGLTRTLVAVDAASAINTVDIAWSGTTGSASRYIDFMQPIGSAPANAGETWTASLFYQMLVDDPDITKIELLIYALNSSSAQVGSPAVKNIYADRLSWKRHEVTFANLPANTAFVLFRLLVTHVSGVSMTCQERIGSPQIEQGAFATSPIRTTGSAATRQADQITRTLGAEFNPVEGTFYAEALHNPGTAGLASDTLLHTDDGTASNRMMITRNIPNIGGFVVTSGGVTGFDVAPGSAIADGSVSRIAGAYKAADCGVSSGGSTVATGAAAIPVVSTLRLGTRPGGTVPLNGYIRRVTYFPERLSNTELQALTA